jgi:cytochrome c oxidase subunit 2
MHDEIHLALLWICSFTGAAVFGAILWSVVQHRRQAAGAAHFHGSVATEFVWNLIPILIVILLALPAIDSAIAMKPAQAEPTARAGGH